jgi:crotonobetainyl-CoA:carnitine CoA-transferase CaiB-like acyl-CoA transferase
VTPALPLQGLLVADFTRVLAGPLCTQMLADFGARVLKIEEPRGGDETRRWGPPFVNGVSAYFLSVNRGKESVAIDLKRDRKLARAIVRAADVVIDNFLPAQREALLGDVRRVNRKAVFCSISGFDSDTNEAARPGYDLLAQAGAGLMSITGEPDGEPMKIGVALADVLTAHHAFGAICAALRAREKTGRGARIEISLFSATLASLVNVAQNALVTGREAQRYGNAHPSIVPYQLFHAADRPFAIGAGTDRHFELLCGVIARPEVANDERYATNAARVAHREELVALLESIFATKKATHWVARCRRAGVPSSLVHGVKEALRSEPGRALVATMQHGRAGAYETLRNPVRLDGQRLPLSGAPPELGQHTEAAVSAFAKSRTAARSTRRGRPRAKR